MNMQIQHYKGGRYNLLMIARHTEGHGDLAIYQSIDDGQLWARPIGMMRNDRFRVTREMIVYPRTRYNTATEAARQLYGELPPVVQGQKSWVMQHDPYKETAHIRIMAFINLMGATSEECLPHTKKLITKIYTCGNCVNFAKALRMIEPEGEIVTVNDGLHAVFKLNGRYYDVTGQVYPEDEAKFVEGFLFEHNYCHLIGGAEV